MNRYGSPTRMWSALSSHHQALAREYLTHQVHDQGLDITTASLTAQLLPQIDLTPLLCDMREVGRIVGVGRDRVRDWHEDGMMPHALCRVSHERRFVLMWDCIAQTLRAHRDEHPRPQGRGARYWP